MPSSGERYVSSNSVCLHWYKKSKQLAKAALPSRTGAEACAGMTTSKSRAITASTHARPSCTHPSGTRGRANRQGG